MPATAAKHARSIRPPIKWHGGKHYLARRIIEHFPVHDTYVEPFAGMASVMLNKPPSPVEVLNDLDENVYNFFRVLREHADAFAHAITLTPYSEAEFRHAHQVAVHHMIERARRFYVRSRQSIGGRGDAFSYTMHRVRRCMADVVSGWLSSIDDNLPLVVDRLRRVQMMCRPALEVIRKWDSPSTLFYCDPPYVPATRRSRDVYSVEMGIYAHFELIATLERCQGKVVLSGYPSKLYRVLLPDWNRVTFDMPNHSAGGRSKQRRTECLWMNY